MDPSATANPGPPGLGDIVSIQGNG
jgi:hypothetical protein